VLAIEGFGVRDDFFELGGNSLRAVRLIAQIELTFGRRLSAAVLLETPTIEHMARVLRGPAAGEESTVVRLFGHPKGRPIFLIPGGAGQPFRFMYLAHELGFHVGVYSMHAQRITTVAAQAARLNEDMCKIQERGPYRLGGYCYGGVVAFEAARQLHLSGERVDFLGIIDTPSPGNPETMVMETDATHLPAYIRELMAASQEAYRQYRGCEYPGRGVLIQVSQAPTQDARKQIEGWNQYIRGGLDVHVIAGDHFTALNPPHVKKLAAVFLPYLVGSVE
jgi:thioesterase domain-containing protein